MRVLITGGAGFIGSHLCDRLIDQGHKVMVLDNLDPQVHGEDAGPPAYLNSAVEFAEGDVRDAADVGNALSWGPNAVVHLAAKVGVGQGQYEISEYTAVNCTGTAVLLEHLDQHQHVERLIVASSMSCYGEGLYICEEHGVVRAEVRSDEQLDGELWMPFCGLRGADGKPCRKTPIPTPIAEWSSLRPQGIYAETKRTTEQLALMWGNSRGVPTAALRLFNTYGSRQALGNPYTGVAAIFTAQIKAGQRPTIYEDGWQARDFIHVHDVAEAFARMVGPASLKVARKGWSSPKANGPFNVGTGSATTILQLAEELIALGEVDLEPEITGRYRSGDIRCCYADRGRMEKLGWEPQVTLEAGLAEWWMWAAEQETPTKLQGVAEAELQERALLRGGECRNGAA